MNPIYKFELTANGTTQRAFPIYKDDLAKDFEKESNQEFFRAKLSGKFTFQSDDYTFIVSQAFDTQFVLEIFISYNAGQSWTSYWRGTFWKTDCEFDGDAETVIVQPTVWDQYNDVLAGMDKEYNLIELAPEIVPVKADKRPMIQVYVPGQSVIGCFLSGMWWEQECESVLETDTITIDNVQYNALEYKYHFALNKIFTMADVSGTMTPQLPSLFGKSFLWNERFTLGTVGTTDFVGTEYTMRYFFQAGGGGATQRWQILRNSDSVVLWQKEWSGGTIPDTSLPQTVELTPVSGAGATGNVTLYVHDIPVYSRFVLDTEELNGLATYEIPNDDIVENNRNYTRVIGYLFPDTIYFSTRLSTTPNKWGLYQPGQYYYPPYLYWEPELFPVARNAWTRVSVWFTFSAFDWIVEESGRQSFTIRHAYPLASVISVLLAKIASGITHAGTTDYSQFLYGQNLIGITQTLLITPKSNLVTAGYDQPAQKAPITLKNVLDMLRDCFRCYWFIDEENRFRIEHIQYFRNGGSYSGTPIVGIDLTAEKVTRNNKEWAFARNQYKFDKPNMAARYQFGWMDDVTQLFEGFPIDIISEYVNPDNIEQINVSKFTSDVDYILLNPGNISKDGYVLMAAMENNITKQSTMNITAGSNHSSDDGRVLIDIKAGEHFTLKLSNGSGQLASTVIGVQIYVKYGENNPSVRIGFYNFTPGVEREFIADNDITSIGAFFEGVYIVSSGSAFLTAKYVDGLKLPYGNFQINNSEHILQNAWVAFMFLQQYYVYDMPAYHFEINGVQMVAVGIKKLKNQTLRFPVLTDPDLVELVKTNLGNGMIEKLSINLSSRSANVTLRYDTE